VTDKAAGAVAIERASMDYRWDLARYVSRLIGENDAQDVVQDLFLHLLDTLPGWIGLDDVRRFLFVAARRKALDWIRKRNRCEVCDPMDFIGMSTNDGEREARELRDWVESILSPDLSRLICWRLDGWDIRELAAREMVAPATIKRRLADARKKLALEQKNELFERPDAL
jgi:RNA polymerase sigma factor (sigma-70 family)